MSKLYKRLATVFVPVAVFALVGAGCGDDAQNAFEEGFSDAINVGGTDIGVEETTAAAILPDVRTFLAEEANAPDAVLVGLNSSEDGFYITDFTPPTESLRNTDGVGSRWYYMFAKNADALSDNNLEEEEMVVVEFNQGKLREVKDLFILSEEIHAVAGADDWKIDTDRAFDLLVEQVIASEDNESGSAPSCIHIDYTMGTLHSYHFENDDPFNDDDDRALVYDITCYEEGDRGWEAKVDATTGDITGVNPVEFSYSSF